MNGPTDESPPIINIKGEWIGLGPHRRELIETYQRWINNFETMRTLATIPPAPVTFDQETAWFENLQTSSDTAAFTVYELDTWRPVGNTALTGIDHRNRSATFGIMIGEPDARNQGYGSEVTRLMLDYAFTALGLHNVMLLVAEFNYAGIRAYEKAGFQEFGRRREVRYMGGRWWDDIYMQALATDFSSPVLGCVFGPGERR